MILVFSSIIIALLYYGLIVWLLIGFIRVGEFNSSNNTPEHKFSLLIPFRNEAENLPQLLNCISTLNYPKNLYEVILVNDDSQDFSEKIIIEFIKNHPELDIQLMDNIRTSNAPKKDAISTGIQKSKNEWIVTTDADCILPKNWLLCFNSFIQITKPKLICAPVSYTSSNTFFQSFQSLDFSSLMAATIGAFGIGKPFLCNGANLCYSKSAFLDVNGFNGNDHITSGDDVFTLEKFVNHYPNQVHFLKSRDAIVLTKPVTNLRSLIIQRVRWASKTSDLKNNFGKVVGLVIFAMNFLLICLFFGYLINSVNPILVLTIFILKLSIDSLLLYHITAFSKQLKMILLSPIIALIHPYYIFFAAIISLLKIKFSWKGR